MTAKEVFILNLIGELISVGQLKASSIIQKHIKNNSKQHLQ